MTLMLISAMQKNTYRIFVIFEKCKGNKDMVPQFLPSVANCISMWCMLSMFSRSTLHSVVFFKSEYTQSSP